MKTTTITTCHKTTTKNHEKQKQKQKQTLKQELQLHLGVLQQHAALIGGPNATACPICHKLFLGTDALTEHIKHVHKDKTPYPTPSKWLCNVNQIHRCNNDKRIESTEIIQLQLISILIIADAFSDSVSCDGLMGQSNALGAVGVVGGNVAAGIPGVGVVPGPALGLNVGGSASTAGGGNSGVGGLGNAGGNGNLQPNTNCLPSSMLASLASGEAAKRRSANHPCSVCGKTYVNEGSLRKHLACHAESTHLTNSLRMWPCSVCQAVFTHENGK